MVRVKSSYANAHWAGGTDTRSNPTCTPLLEGTYDYVTGMTTLGGSTYYALGSGKRTAAGNVEMLNAGYKLPLNSLQAGGWNDGGAYVLRFGVKWKIPFNLELKGQTYSAAYGFSGYTYGVPSYAATGVAITFYHTGAYGGSLDMGGSPLFSQANWTKNAEKNTVTLTLTFRGAGNFYGYKAYYENNQLMIRMQRKPPSGLSGAKIYLDAGHGGSDPGSKLVASHPTLTHEKYVTVIFANKLKAKLEARGATVYMTRTTDIGKTLAERTKNTRSLNPDLFVSLHTDSTSTATPMGTTAFYYRAYGQPLAIAIHNRLVSAWKEKIYTPAAYSNYAALRGKVDHKTYFYPFEVTRIEECPAVLIEYGFGSNLTESRALQKDQNQDILAQATLEGIADYLGSRN
jgi:N-acetylmuramoyl-L-alanine amidase